MNKHLPYNVLLAIAVSAAGLMVVCNLALRQSSFAVTVGYRLPQPQPAVSEEASPQTHDPAPGEPGIWITPPETQSQSGADPEIFSVQFPLELNQATFEQLLFIPQVGNVTAQRIIQYREHLGGYSSLEQLLEIRGIGGKTYEQITAYLYLAGESIPPPDETPHEGFEEDGETDISDFP